MAATQLVSYTVLTVNYRAIGAGNIPAAMLTDATASALSYFIVRRVARSEGLATLLGMMVGGAVAAALGIWLTRNW